MDRRKFIQTSTLTAAAMVTTSAARTPRPRRSRKEGIEMKKSGAFWPNGARLVVFVSMQQRVWPVISERKNAVEYLVEL